MLTILIVIVLFVLLKGIIGYKKVCGVLKNIDGSEGLRL